MIGIAILTARRMREPAFFLLFLIGLLCAWQMSTAGVADLAHINSSNDEELKRGVLMGMLLLIGLAGLVAVFFAASEIPRDIHSGMIDITLSKPLSRAESSVFFA